MVLKEILDQSVMLEILEPLEVKDLEVWMEFQFLEIEELRVIKVTLEIMEMMDHKDQWVI